MQSHFSRKKKPLKESLQKFFKPRLLSDISFRDYAKKLAARSPKKEEDRKGNFENWSSFTLSIYTCIRTITLYKYNIKMLSPSTNTLMVIKCLSCKFWSKWEFISIQPIVTLYLTRIELHNYKMKASKTFKTVIFEVAFFFSKL